MIHNLPPEIFNSIKSCKFYQIFFPCFVSIVVIEPETPGVLQRVFDQEFWRHLCGATGLSLCRRSPLENTGHFTPNLTYKQFTATE